MLLLPLPQRVYVSRTLMVGDAKFPPQTIALAYRLSRGPTGRWRLWALSPRRHDL